MSKSLESDLKKEGLFTIKQGRVVKLDRKPKKNEYTFTTEIEASEYQYMSGNKHTLEREVIEYLESSSERIIKYNKQYNKDIERSKEIREGKKRL